jgi:Domain of unknown function (DUF222)
MSELLSVIDALAAVDPRTLSEPESLVELEELLRARDQLDGVIAARLQAADARNVTVHECGRHSRSWLVEEMRLSPEEAGRRMNVARSTVFHPVVAAATLAGDISHDHARVIVSCLRRLLPPWERLRRPSWSTQRGWSTPSASVGCVVSFDCAPGPTRTLRLPRNDGTSPGGQPSRRRSTA